jgi:hypothetical protein
MKAWHCGCGAILLLSAQYRSPVLQYSLQTAINTDSQWMNVPWLWDLSYHGRLIYDLKTYISWILTRVNNNNYSWYLVWVPAPSREEEGSGTLCIDDLFFTPHGYHGAPDMSRQLIEYELVIATRFTFCDMELRNACIPQPNPYSPRA